MKIAIVSSSYHPYYKGGGEHSVRDLAEGLVKAGHNIFVITAYYHTKKEVINGVKVIRVRHPNIYWSFDSANQSNYRKVIWHAFEGINIKVEKSVKNILIEEKPDVLHIRNSEDFAYICKTAKKLGIPTIVTTNSCIWLCPKGTMYKNNKNCTSQCIDCKLITYPKKRLSRYADVLIGVSQFMVDLHKSYNYFPNANKCVIHTSVPALFTGLPLQQNSYFTLGFIGRLHPIKGVAELIQAFRKLPQTNIKLIIAGSGDPEYYNYCKELAEGDIRIQMVGKVTPAEFYPTIDILIINSLVNDAFPRVLAEAYAAGRPVIASATGGITEKVLDGKTGFLFYPHKEDSLYQALSQVTAFSHEKLLEMHEFIKSFYLQNFPDSIHQHILAYKALLKNSSHSRC